LEIEFEPDSLNAIANKSIQRKTGARGLRSILEESLLDTMYHLPSIKKNVKKIIIDTDVVKGQSKPILIHPNKIKK